MSPARSRHQRRTDTLAVLESHGSGWLATAATDGTPRVIAVAIGWDGTLLTIATRDGTPTARNLDAVGRARLVIGSPADAILIDTRVESTLPADADAGEVGRRFVAAMGWDPANEGLDWRSFLLRPTQIEAYQGYFELGDHVLMRDGAWHP